MTTPSESLVKSIIDNFSWSHIKGSKLRTCWVEVDPTLASAILSALNKNNRPISKVLVDKYKIDMDNGTWGTGESNICISDTYRLLNGQHRLAAVVAHGKPVGFMFTFGLSNKEFMNMDAGKKRTNAQKLIIGGVATRYASQLSSVANYLLEYQHGGIGGNGYGVSPTSDEIYSCVKRWVTEFTQSIAWVKANLKRYKINSADAAFAHFCITQGRLKGSGKNFIDLFTSYSNGDISKYDLTKSGSDNHPIVALADQFTLEMGMTIQDQHITRIRKGVHICEAFTRDLAGERFRKFTQTQWPQKSVFGDFDIA